MEKELPQSAVSDLKASYKAWLRALISTLEGSSVASLQRILVAGAKPNDPIHKATYAVVNTWVRRATLPDDNNGALSRLTLLVNQFVVGRPAGVLDLPFEQVVKELKSHRDSSSKQGRAVNRLGKELYENNSLMFEPVSVKDLDQLSLNLGSGLFDGKLPPYSPREIDVKIRDLLDDNASRLVVIVGPPKAGKTRTLVENLKQSSLKDSNVYWLEPAANSAMALIRALPENDHKTNVAVLDDLQFFRFDGEGGITPGVMAQLMKRCMVVATLHTDILTQWTVSQTDRSLESRSGLFAPPSRAVQGVLASHSIELEVDLSDSELLALESVFNKDLLEKVSFRKLASALSASKVLINRAKRLRDANDPFSLATFRALMDARILYPSGFTLDELEEFAREELEAWSNQDWDESEWTRLKRYCTTGLNAASPHAILMRSISDKAEYTLFDPIWESLRPQVWSAKNIAGEDRNLSYAASRAYEAGYIEEALRLTALCDIENSGESQFMMGFYGLSFNDAENTEKWFRKSLESGYEDAELALAGVLMMTGRFEEAEPLLQNSLDRGEEGASLDLGFIFLHRGQLDKAEEMIRRAQNVPELSAMATHNLGAVCWSKNKIDAAIEHFENARKLGVALSSDSLGRLYFELRDLEKAETYLMEGEQQGLAQSALYLGKILYIRGDAESAKEKFMQAIAAALPAWEGYSQKLSSWDVDEEIDYAHFAVNPLASKATLMDAEYCLALAHGSLGDFIKRDEHLVRSHSAGSHVAANELGLVRLEQGEIEQAKAFFEEAHDAGVIWGTNNLGLVEERLGNLPAAEAYYRQAYSAGVMMSAANLGSIYWRQDKENLALPLLDEARAAGIVEATLT
jgi:TPR repeat protein